MPADQSIVKIMGDKGLPALQKAGTGELITEDTGLHTNPEQWLQDNHWQTPAEVVVAAAGAPGEQNLDVVVPAGQTRRIRELTIRHAGTNNTVVTLKISGAGATVLTLDVPAQTTRIWSSEDGRSFAAGTIASVQTSNITGGSTYITASGVQK